MNYKAVDEIIFAVIWDHHMHTSHLDKMISTTTMRIPNFVNFVNLIWLMRQWMKSIIAVIWDHHIHTLDLDKMISTTTMRIPNSTILQALKRHGKAWEGG